MMGTGPFTSSYLLQAGDSGLTADKVEVTYGHGVGSSFSDKIKAGPDQNIRRLRIKPKAAFATGIENHFDVSHPYQQLGSGRLHRSLFEVVRYENTACMGLGDISRTGSFAC